MRIDTVSFGNFDTISLEAQAISLSGSFSLIEGSSSVDLEATNGSALISAGNNLNVNAQNIGITSTGNDVNFSADNGELTFVAGSEFVTTSESFYIHTEVGGALFNSQGGDIAVQSSGNLIVNSNDELNVRSTYDILITTPQDIAFTSAEGEIDIASLHDITVNAEDSITITSIGQRVSFNAGDYLITNSGSFSAAGNKGLNIQSFTSSIKFNSFGNTAFSSNGDLTVQGDTKGVSLFSTGENTGIIQLTSTSRSIYFTSQGNGDEETGVLANVDSVNATITRSVNFLSRGDGIIRSNGDINIDAVGGFEIDTENVNVYSQNFDVTSSTGFTLGANNINLYSFDDATSGNTLGYIDVSAANIRYTASDDIVLHGGDLEFTATTGDLTLTADTIILSASRGDNSQHSITLNGTELLYSGNDAYFYGGEIDIIGGGQEIFAGGDINFSTRSLTPNYIRNLATDDIQFNIPSGSLAHTAYELTFYSFYAGGDSLTSGLSFTSSGNIVASSDTGYDITMISKTYFNVDSQDSILFQAFDADLQITETFSATGDAIQITANDFSLNSYSLYFDSLDNDGLTNNQNIQFTAGRNFLLSTPRNENGDDTISATYSDILFDQEDLFFSGGESGTFTAGTFTILSNGITLSSDDRENINFHIGSLTLTASETLNFDGDSVSFASPLGTNTIFTTGNFTLHNDDRGLLVHSDGSFSLSADTSSISTPDNIVIDSDGAVSFNTLQNGPFHVNAEKLIDIHSTFGPVELSSNGIFNVSSGDSIYFNTGAYDGNLFSTNSNNIYFDTTDSLSTTVDVGNLAINVDTAATLTSADISFIGEGVVNIHTAVFSLNTITLDSFGGNIDISSTTGDITWHSTQNFNINSTESSLAGQEIDRITYEILFSSGDDLSITTDAPGGQIYSKSDLLEINAFKPSPYGQEGQILFSGADTTLTSNLLNQFIQFTSGGLINITASDLIHINSDGDYFIQAANSAQFYGASIHHYMHESITIDAVLNSCVNISHIGNNLNFYVTALTVPKFYNDLEFKSTDFLYIQAGDGPIVATANGVSTKRQNEDGNTNGDLVFNEEVSIVLRSRHQQGNIIIEAQDNIVDFQAEKNTIIVSLQEAFFYSLTGQSYISGTTTKFEAESGNVTMRAGHDYTLTAAGSLYFASTQNTTSLAEDYIYFSVNDQLDIIANSGDVFFNTYYGNDINVNGQDIYFISGTSGSSFIAQGDVSVISSEFNLNGERGINLLTNEGPILFDSSASTAITSSEELFVKSGNNVVTTSGTATSFAGKGVVFGSTAADVLMQSSNDIIVTSKTAVLQSLGTSQTGRDRVAFNSEDITFQSLSVHVDATELVQIGKTTLPVVSITASGTDAISGAIFDVAASSTFITEGKLLYSSVLGETDINGTSAVTFDAEGSINIANSNFNINAITGSVLLNSHDDINITVTNSATYISDHFLQFSSTDSDPTDGILFEFETETQTGHFLNIQLDNGYTAEVDILLFYAPEQGGGVRFEAPQGFLSITTVNDATFYARSDITISSKVDTTFNTKSLTLNTVAGGEGDVILQAQNNFDLTTSKTVSFSGDYVTLSAPGPASDISLTSPLIAFTSVEGSFISNSTQGSQSFTSIDLTQTIANYATFSFSDLSPFEITTGSFTVSNAIGTITAGDEINLTAFTTFTTNAYNDLSFAAFDQISFTSNGAALAFTFTTTLEDIFFTTTNDLNHLRMTADVLNVDTYSLNFRAGSEQEREDLRILTNNVVIQDTQTSFVAQPTSVRVATPVTAQFPNIIFRSDYITFNSTSTEEGFGGIYIGDPDLTQPIVVSSATDVVFLSEAARLITEVDDQITFQATNMLMNTNGLDTFIKFDSTASTTLTGNTYNLFSKDKTRIASDSDDLLVHGDSLSVAVNGPNDGDGNGVVVSATYNARFLSQTLTARVDATRFTALKTIDISSATTTFTGNTIYINAEQGRENPLYQPTNYFYNPYGQIPRLDFVGVNIDSPNLRVAAATELTFNSEILENNGILLATVTGSIQYNAKENFQITTTSGAGTTTWTTNDFLLNTKGGITLHGQAAGMTFTANTGTILFEAGNDAQDSAITFSSNGGTISVGATTTMTALINNNILFESSEDIFGTTTTGSISFRATRGDILFRSISSSSIHRAPNTLFDVTIQSTIGNNIVLLAGRSIRHIDHWGLGFFCISCNPANSGRPAPTDIAGSLVTDRGPVHELQGGYNCFCSDSCACPEATNRIYQMYEMFLNYGLIKYIN